MDYLTTSQPRISKRVQALIERGNDGSYVTDFAVDRAIALAAVNAGHNEQWLHTVLFGHSTYVQEIKSRYGQGRAQRYVAKTFRDAEVFKALHPPVRTRTDVVGLLAEQLDTVHSQPWPGNSGRTDCIALTALIRLAIRFRNTTVSVSTRQLAELVGYLRKQFAPGQPAWNGIDAAIARLKSAPIH